MFKEFQNLSTTLPDSLTFSLVLDAGSDPDASYVDIKIKDVAGTDNPFEGLTFDGYCIDTDRKISQNTEYTAQVYSSYDLQGLEDAGLTGTGLIEKPENLDLINWIINQDFEGKTATNGETFTSGDVQRAIWSLIDDQNSTGNLGAWTQEKVDEIVTLATTNGEGFVPTDSGKMAVILIPEGLNQQFVIIEVELSKLGEFEGCTPGYWKGNAANFERRPDKFGADTDGDSVNDTPALWAPTGVDLDDPLSSGGFSGFTVLDGDNTSFQDALNATGGGENALMRHAAAAFLNASHPDITYEIFNPDALVDQVNEALASGSSNIIEQTKNELDDFNNAGCSIDQFGRLMHDSMHG